MTNNWTDIGNASLVLTWGANPSENHPACMAHVNKARDNQNVIWPSTGLPSTLSAWAGTKGAKLVVIDPRKTRTAVVADRYIRHRPGTDIALINGVLAGIIAKMEDTADTSVTPAQRTSFFDFLNWKGNGSFYTDGNDAGDDSTLVTTVPNCSKYTDARFILKADGSDYERDRIVATTGVVTTDPASATTISNFPRKATTVDADPNTVYNRLKAHLAPYTPDVVSGITGVSEADIDFLVDAFIYNSRCSSVVTAGLQDPRVAGYRATTILYAMGITQHTNGSQNIKDFANIQTIMGNMGRAGGGINALRGIHNVQGSTDQGLLYGNIPYYSGNPTAAQTFGQYMDTLWGYPLSGTGTRTNMNLSYDDAYNTAAMGLQQRGFINMTYNFFGGGTIEMTAKTSGTPATVDRAFTDGLYKLWPKGPGDDHITMFRKMITGETRALVCWGQNPAVTEPNQSKIRDGLYNLDTLVVTDMFATETAMCSRKDDGVTYLLPACAHVEEAGSVTNSGRVLQWREKATKPKGKSKADLELMFRFAHALDGAGAFSHITTQWAAIGKTETSAYSVLYATPYGWTPTAGVNDFETANHGSAEVWAAPKVADGGVNPAPVPGVEVYGSEWIAELIYRGMCTAGTGISWLYTGAYNTTMTVNTHFVPGTTTPVFTWKTANRAKSRDNTDFNGTLAYPAWGYSWLVNRRVLYNNGDVPGDVTDYFMGPDSASRLFVSTKTGVLNYSRWYRTIHMLSDKPDVALAGPTAEHILPGRFPAHTEPYETPREDLAAVWGRNTKGTAAWDLIKADSNVAATGRSHDPDEFPFVLTTIRCVEHFQGGPITRNNPWNVEAEPWPWVEINSVDALTLGIKDGQYVNIVTARGDSMGTLTNDTAFPTVGWAKGFKARVGAGTEGNQRVAPGTVAIPWHWGDQGLSKGSRANDLCIDAGDANTMIPESKACLCKLVPRVDGSGNPIMV